MGSIRSPISGRIYKTDGSIVNIVDLLNTCNVQPVKGLPKYDIDEYAPLSGFIIGEDGKVYSLAELLTAINTSEETIMQAIQTVLASVTEINGGTFNR